MDFSVFPSEYENKMRAESRNKTEQIKRQSDDRIRDFESKLTKRKPMPGICAVVVGAFYGACIGLFIGGILCTFMCMSDTEIDLEALFLICGSVGAVISAVMCYQDEERYSETFNYMNKSIYEEKRNTPKRVQDMEDETERKIKAYRDKFEEAAKEMSIKFAESQLATEVIQWMTKGFSETIDSADRRSHIERIEIPFVFKVYGEKITCNLGVFDFEIKRCHKLETPLERTALARAIASAIQLNITIQYPKDASGTDIITNIDYCYEKEAVSANLVYTAVNGNYQAVRDWSE